MTLRMSLGMATALCGALLVVEGCATKKVATAKTPEAPAPASAPATVAKAPEPARTAAQPPRQTAQNNTPRMPDQATKDRIEVLLNRIQDAFFDYDSANIRSDAIAALRGDVETLRLILKDYPEYKLTIEGYCDERGSDEYNLALGDQRAKHAKDFLVNSGITADQLLTVSYGKERPVCTEKTEDCWQKNRRIHITQKQAM